MITKHRTLFLIGLLITLIPLLGFPSVYETVAIALLGLLVSFIAFLLAREKRLGLTQASSVSVAPSRSRRSRADRIHADHMPAERPAATPLPPTSEDVPPITPIQAVETEDKTTSLVSDVPEQQP